jgi:hypothetical protein
MAKKVTPTADYLAAKLLNTPIECTHCVWMHNGQNNWCTKVHKISRDFFSNDADCVHYSYSAEKRGNARITSASGQWGWRK